MMIAAVPTMSMIVTATKRPNMAAVSRVVGDEVIIVTGAAVRVILKILMDTEKIRHEFIKQRVE